jgi:hypothetical protein
MKTSIKTLFATGLIALALSSSTVYANNVAEPLKKEAASAINVAAIKRLVITGNVEVTISQQPKSRVLYSNEGTADVTVKKIGNALYVSSKNDSQPGKITVYVDDIYRIEASDNAVVLTKGILNVQYLQVFLKDKAYLDLNAKTESLYTVMKSTSELILKGATEAHTISMDRL